MPDILMVVSVGHGLNDGLAPPINKKYGSGIGPPWPYVHNINLLHCKEDGLQTGCPVQ